MSFPADLLEQVIEFLVPVNVVVLQSSEEATKTLVAFTKVCRFSSNIAYPLLYRCCLDIDSPRKLRLILRSFQSRRVRDAISQYSKRSMGMFLSPCPNEDAAALDILEQIEELLGIVSDKLERLICDVPLAHLYDLAEHEHKGPTSLVPVFDKLLVLKDYCSIRDQESLQTVYCCQEPYFWGSLPSLERLALVNPANEPEYVGTLIEAKKLTNVHAIMTNRFFFMVPAYSTLPRSLKSYKYIILAHDLPYDFYNGEEPHAHDQTGNGIGQILDIDVPFAKRGEGLNDWDQRMNACREFILQHACAGSLWDLGNDSV